MEEPLPHSRAVWFPEGNTVSVSIGGVIVVDTVRDIVVVEYGTVVEAEVVEVVEVVDLGPTPPPDAITTTPDDAGEVCVSGVLALSVTCNSNV